MKSSKIDLSIVIPALNEEKRIGATLDELSVFLRKDPYMKKLNCEVIVVCAKGVDRTKETSIRHGKSIDNFKVVSPGSPVGKGRDVRFGMLKSKGAAAVYMDADLATPLIHLPEFHSLMIGGFNIVAATRNLKNHHSHLARRALSIIGNAAYKLLGGIWIEDSQCGFKLFDRQAVRICFNKQTIMKWGFDMELLTIADVNKLLIKQVRIEDWVDQPGGTFITSQIIRNSIMTFNDLLVIATNRLMGRYRESKLR